MVLQPAVFKNVLPQVSLNKSDIYNVPAVEPLCPVSPLAVGAVLHSSSEGSTEKIDWDRWATSLLALLKVVSVCNNGADTISAVLNRGTAEQLLDQGSLAAVAADIPQEVEGPREIEHIAEVVSTTHKGVIGVVYQTNVIHREDQEQVINTEPETFVVTPAPCCTLGEHLVIALDTSSGEEAHLRRATSKASVNESFHIPRDMKDPRMMLGV